MAQPSLFTLSLAAGLVITCSLIGCPGRESAIDAVGGAPRAQVDRAKAQLKGAERKLEQHMDEAAAAQ